MSRLPPPAPVFDAESAAYWEGLRRHQVLVQRCVSCGRLQFPFRAHCTSCLAAGPESIAVSGRGRVLSWVVTHQVLHPSFADLVPYTTALVQLDEQPDLLMFGDIDPAEVPLKPLARVRAKFVDYDDFALIAWTTPTQER
jgi:uncharacterized protein